MTLTIEDGGKVEALERDDLRTGTQQMMFDAGYTRAVCVGECGTTRSAGLPGARNSAPPPADCGGPRSHCRSQPRRKPKVSKEQGSRA